MDNVIIFDTALRDGEQAAGAMLNMEEKLEIAKQLERLGVDVIEAGFPAASPDDLASVQGIARDVGNPSEPDARVPIIAGLARANRNDIDKCWEAVGFARHPRIHTFLATSDIHLEHKLKMSRAKDHCPRAGHGGPRVLPVRGRRVLAGRRGTVRS